MCRPAAADRSRLAVRAPQQARHLLLEAVVQRFLGRGRAAWMSSLRARRTRLLAAGGRLPRLCSRSLGVRRRATLIALGWTPQRRLQALRHFGEILIGCLVELHVSCRRRRRRRGGCRARGAWLAAWRLTRRRLG